MTANQSNEQSEGMSALLEEWLPPTISSLPRTEDCKLLGTRLPLTEAEVRRQAQRPYVMCDFGDVNWFRNVLTMNSKRLIDYVDALSAWESEGGR